MQPPREVPAAGPSRRSVLRLLGVGGLAAGTAGLGACSAGDRDALLSVDPRDVRLDDGVVPRPEEPGPSARELRRRAVRGGSLAAAAALDGAGDALTLPGRTGGGADRVAAGEVHRVHAAVLAGSPAPAVPGPPSPLLVPEPVPAEGGPTLAPPARPAAVLRTGWSTALGACGAELREHDAQGPLALLHAWVASARAAQASALGGAAAAPGVWPTVAAGAPVVDALQGLLAQEHRARWSYAVVLAWSTDRAPDAEAARADHTRRVAQLTDLLVLLGADPVPALATYPTDDGGRPVDGPVSAASLALRIEDDVTAAAAAVLAAAVDDAADRGDRGDTADGGDGADGAAADLWVRAGVRSLAEAERARWSWGGAPVPWPGAVAPPG